MRSVVERIPEVLQTQHAIRKAGRSANLLLCNMRIERDALLLQYTRSVSRKLGDRPGDAIELCAAQRYM
jgi:hypothetical protein